MNSVEQWESNPLGFKFRWRSPDAFARVASQFAAAPGFGRVSLAFDRIAKDDQGRRRVADVAFREWGHEDSLHAILFRDPSIPSVIHLDSRSIAVGKDSRTGAVIYSDDLADLARHVGRDLLHIGR